MPISDWVSVSDLLLWVLTAGMVGFVAMGLDKVLARSHWDRRVSEKTLWLTALAGGFGGVILGALTFHHKTSKAAFWPPVVLATIIWTAVFVFTVMGFSSL